MWLYLIISILIAYLLLSLCFTYLVHQIPRKPVKDVPNWGHIIDTKIPAADEGILEVWRIEPEGRSRGIVVLSHGWSRNRGRMVSRAKIFGEMGFTTVIHSARDHGDSTRHRLMNAFRFAEDIEAVIEWIDEPVLLYGHSLGAAGAIIVASQNPDKIKLLFLEGCYAQTKEALRRLYRNHNRLLGTMFAHIIVLSLDIINKFRLNKVNPTHLAPKIDIPVLIIHGEKDQHFPLDNAWKLRDSFPAARAEFFVGKGADHSSSSFTPAFPIAIRAFVDRNEEILTNVHEVGRKSR